MRPLFLAFCSPTGERKYAALQTANEPIFFLPSGVEGEDIELTTAPPPGRYDYAQIELLHSVPFLSIFGKEIGRLSSDGVDVDLPPSTANKQWSVLLRDGDHFETSAGEWVIERDDEQRTIQNSMRPPQIPEPPLEESFEPLKVEEPQQEAHSIINREMPSEEDRSESAHNVPFSEVEENEALPDSSPSTDLVHRKDSCRKHFGNMQWSQSQGSEDGSAVAQLTPISSITKEDAKQQEEDVMSSRKATVVVLGETESMEPEEHFPRKRRMADPEQEPASKKPRTARKKPVDKEDTEANVEAAETIIVQAPLMTSEQRSSPEKKLTNRRGRSAKKPSLASTPKRASGTPNQLVSPSPVPSISESTRSRRSMSIAHPELGDYHGSPIVFFASSTTIDEKKKTMKTFRSLGGKVANSIIGANVLCVGDGMLKKTGSVMLAIAQGADIVTEQWIAQAHRCDRLLDPSNFLPKEQGYEQDWGTSLSDAIKRGKEGLTHLLDGMIIYITAQLQQDFAGDRLQSLRNVATAIGAHAVKTNLPKKKPSSSSFVVGSQNDPEAARVGRLGMRLYDKEVLTTAVLKGVLDLENSSCEIAIPVKEEASQ